MNITNWANIPNITNQITTGALQAGLRQDSRGTVQSGGSNTTQLSTLTHLDLSGRKGYREEYSVRDAAESLWKQETQTFNLRDLQDPEKAHEILENARRQARWDLGIEQGETKDEVLSAYVQNLRQNGLDGAVDWSGLSRELKAFQTTTPEELADGLDYLASRYTAVLDKLERNCKGEELTAQKAQLENVYQAGKSGMIESYTKLLQDNLGISNQEAQRIKDSFSAILTEKTDAYRGALQQVHETITKTGADSVWLKNHDAYIASQLRAANTASQSKAAYTVQDLTLAGQLAQGYQTEIRQAGYGSRNEATLALNIAMVDMKAETMIEKGFAGKNMAALLRNSRAQGHEKALYALNQTLTKWENNRAQGEPKGTFAPVDRAVFQGIYNSVMNTYQTNGGDAVKAIRAGVSHGQTVTAQAAVRTPQALRWGISMQSYWKNFYTTPTPETENASPLVKQLNRLLIQAGQSTDINRSDYQKYASDWQDFLSSFGGGLNRQA